MEKDKLVDKVIEFLYGESSGFSGVARSGNYDVGKEIFKIALGEYLSSGKRVLDEYDEIIWESWGLSGYPGRDTYFDEDDIVFWKSVVDGSSYWNISSIYSQGQIKDLIDKIDSSEIKLIESRSYKRRRYLASLFTTNQKTRKFVFNRDGKSCVNCKRDDKLTLDHIVPVSKGGEDTHENLQVLCRPCNSSKHTNIIKY